MSAEQSFRTGLLPSAVSFPNRIGLVADLGLTSNSTVTLAHLVANQPDMVIFVGGEMRGDPAGYSGLCHHLCPPDALILPSDHST